MKSQYSSYMSTDRHPEERSEVGIQVLQCFGIAEVILTGSRRSFHSLVMTIIFAMTVFCLLTLSSCSNFRPLYGKNEALSGELSSIEIQEIDTIHGSELYHELTNLIGQSRDTKYLLQITLASEATSPLAITGHANVVKQNVTQLYNYSLTDKVTGKILDSGRIRIVGSYDSLSKPYASYTKEKTLKKNLSQTAAEEIYMRLMLYFSSV